MLVVHSQQPEFSNILRKGLTGPRSARRPVARHGTRTQGTQGSQRPMSGTRMQGTQASLRPTSHKYAGPSQVHEELSQTQAPLSAEETNKLVAEVIRYMLFRNYQHPGVPVSRLDVTGVITKTYKQRYLPSHVIFMAQKRLPQVFGLEMKEYNRLWSKTKSERGINEKQVELKEYVLRSTVSADLRKQYIDTRESAAMYSLTTIVIGIIKCAGEKCPEEILWQNLRRLDIKEEDVDHPTFGNVRTAVEMLAKQRYIQKEKLNSSEGDGFVYELAERALDQQCLGRMEDFMVSIIQRNR